MSDSLLQLSDYLKIQLGSKCLGAHIAYGELAIHVPAEHIETVLWVLRDDPRCLFSQLLEITAVDYPEREKRFEVVYLLLSLKNNQRIKVKVLTDEGTSVPSVVHVYSSAGWCERETWDMYGVQFDGNPDLRRILTDYGFEGHPLRKDFPLTGYVEVRYDAESKRVVYEPVKLTQAFRSFDFLSPWEGIPRELPGDEKSTQ